jgi:hypothetical protein
LHVMVGGDGGVVGPKELVGWVGTVTDGRLTKPRNLSPSDSEAYTPPTPRFTRLKHSFLPPFVRKSFSHKM